MRNKALLCLLLKEVGKSTQGTPGCTRSLWHFCAPKKAEHVRKKSAWVDDGSVMTLKPDRRHDEVSAFVHE